MIKRFATIYIGSGKCELIACQRGKGRISLLERAEHPITFGRQSIEKGRISFSSVRALNRIIAEYISIAEGVAVDDVQIVATSALREAENRLYLTEQIRHATGYPVRILEREEEQSLIYKHLRVMCKEIDPNFLSDRTLMFFIASRAVSAALAEKGMITYKRTYDIGYLKMKEVFDAIEAHTEDAASLMAEYTGINLMELLDGAMDKKIKSLAVSTHDARMLKQILGCPENDSSVIISKKDFEKMTSAYSSMNPSQLRRAIPGLGANAADSLRTTLMLIRGLFSLTDCETMYLCPLSINTAMMGLELYPSWAKESAAWVDASAYASAKALGRRYRIDEKHADEVERIALRLFDTLKKQVAMNERYRFLLRMTSQLLDVGRYIGGMTGRPVNRRVIQASEIIGLSKSEQAIIGMAADCVRTDPFDESLIDKEMSQEDQMCVSVLTAILKLATALDKSHSNKVEKISCRIIEGELVITVTSKSNLQLESYFFKVSGIAMRKVFGLKPVLKIKREN